MYIFSFGYQSSGNYIPVSKAVKIRGYFSKPKEGPANKNVWVTLPYTVG
jgi:hypothetical protein